MAHWSTGCSPTVFYDSMVSVPEDFWTKRRNLHLRRKPLGETGFLQGPCSLGGNTKHLLKASILTKEHTGNSRELPGVSFPERVGRKGPVPEAVYLMI